VDTLTTERLTLRPFSADDVVPMMEMHQDPEVIKHVLLGGAPGDVEAAWRNVAMLIGHWHLRGYGQWAVVEHATGETIGRVGPYNPKGWPGIELGWIIRRDRWGNGFATEAAKAALGWMWGHVDTDRVISIIRPDNLRSIRIAEKIGETLESRTTQNRIEMLVYAARRPGARAR
jgi:RimJ/RimL family protein N-acetyltransferase